ncbi:MAG: hypothetical protein MHM6MM_001838 [Cercozoa sp. M6MM]
MSAPSAMPADNKSLSASEVDFMAQDVLIDVTPHRTLAAFPGLTGHFGPFQLGQRTPVPIWLALQLYKNGEAGISCPKWLDIEHLKHRLEDEKQFESTFSELPLHWYEVYSMLVRHAPEVLSQLEDLKAVVHDLQDLRQSKFKRGLSIITSDPDIAIRLRNIGAVELNRMRPLVAATMDAVHRLSLLLRSHKGGAWTTTDLRLAMLEAQRRCRCLLPHLPPNCTACAGSSTNNRQDRKKPARDQVRPTERRRSRPLVPVLGLPVP